jgi:ribonuclease P protein component
MRRRQRLRRPEQFQRVRREGKSWAHPLMILNAMRNRVGHTRCGFVVGKQFGKAHDRNRVKRRVREAVRLLYDHILPGYDLTFVIRQPAATASFAELQQSITELLQRAKLWQPLPSDQHQETTDEQNSSNIDPILSALHITGLSS